ncbi:hypothetical protein H4R20_004981 [Coemansia guatemalensis]|uniref:Ras modification protein ERF4 n=1 Tax=Coemansia guatemalensis TaxID=2761395 RepID=A0A9W8LQ06_9FUNG|nr:hypothetical protein H4R20_004981 [Coemansia guatemalensis]
MSVDSSSEHWSFENLTQSSESGHPLIGGSDSLKNLNLPLSLVLNKGVRNTRGGPGNTALPARSLSSGSIRGPHLLRRQAGNNRPDSIVSDTLSAYTPPQQNSSQQRLLNLQGTENRMAADSHHPTPAAPGRTSESTTSPVSIGFPGGVSRNSVYSDRAVFAASRSPERALRPYGSASPPPPTMPLAVHSRQSEDTGRQGAVYRSCRSDDQLPGTSFMYNSRLPDQQHIQMRQSPQRPPQSQEQVSRPQSIVALQDMPRHYGADGPPVGNRDYLGPKTYGLPASGDAIGHPASELWRRVRVERDYSQGDERQFVVAVPEQLSGRIDEQRFKRFLRRLNAMLAEAEGATLRNVLEGVLAYATLYISTLVVKPHFKKTIERISSLVAHENKTLFEPAGFSVIDPLQTAYMFIEIVIL